MPIFDVRHQARAHRILQRAMSSHRLPHAYIFHGPDGVGKRTLAMAFARLLLCPGPVTPEPPDELIGDDDIAWRDACGHCEDCRLSAAETHPDLQVVYKALNRYHPAPEVRARKAIDLGVDVVRHFVIERANDRPARGSARVFVVLDSEEMSVAAQNALLKTLEEPPGAAFIILLTRSIDRLLPTTRSRCQPVPFVALPTDFVVQRLRQARPDLPDEQVRFLSRYSNGRLGTALRQADAGIFEAKIRLNEALADLRRVGPSDLAKLVQDSAAKLAEGYIEEMVESGMIEKANEASTTEPVRRGLIVLLSLASCLYRDVIQMGCGRPEEIVNVDQQDQVRTVAARIAPEAAAEAVREIYKTETDVAANANAALAFEALAVRLLRLEPRRAEKAPSRQA
ncbi:MAG: DNA polymerase III subunit [Phycisphaerae bacterium]|nr:DNA polymerase III subunit [Phycisphaerae bacterium]